MPELSAWVPFSLGTNVNTPFFWEVTPEFAHSGHSRVQVLKLVFKHLWHLIWYLGVHSVWTQHCFVPDCPGASDHAGTKFEHSLTPPQYVTRTQHNGFFFLPFSSFIYSKCSLVFSSSLRSLSTVPFLIFTSSPRREFFCFSMLRLDFKLLTNLSYAGQRERQISVQGFSIHSYVQIISCFWHHVPRCWWNLISVYNFFHFCGFLPLFKDPSLSHDHVLWFVQWDAKMWF